MCIRRSRLLATARSVCAHRSEVRENAHLSHPLLRRDSCVRIPACSTIVDCLSCIPVSRVPPGGGDAVVQVSGESGLLGLGAPFAAHVHRAAAACAQASAPRFLRCACRGVAALQGGLEIGCNGNAPVASDVKIEIHQRRGGLVVPDEVGFARVRTWAWAQAADANIWSVVSALAQAINAMVSVAYAWGAADGSKEFAIVELMVALSAARLRSAHRRGLFGCPKGEWSRPE